MSWRQVRRLAALFVCVVAASLLLSAQAAGTVFVTRTGSQYHRAGCRLWAAAGAHEGFSGVVVGVIDGDTISVMRDGTPVRVRLADIDCPERGQDFSQRAKEFTSDQVFGKVVDVRVQDVDRYGRLVA